MSSLKGKGKVAFLREQMESRNILLAGLQETRTTDSSSYDSNYIRLIGPADKGHGGVELWIATSIPYAWSGQQGLYLTRQCVQVLIAEAEILLAEVILGATSVLCCVGHAPHKGYKLADTSPQNSQNPA